jgi:hypothetical protein
METNALKIKKIKGDGKAQAKNSPIKDLLCLGVLILLVVSAGCVGCRVHPDGLTLTITTAEWYLQHDSGTWDSIKLRIIGTTSGERVTIMTYGDGVGYELGLTLDENKNFNQVVTIAFSHERYTPPVQFETTVKAFRGSETTEVKLQSGNIW